MPELGRWHDELDRYVAAAIPGSRATFYPDEGHLSTLVGHSDEIVRELTDQSPHSPPTALPT